MNIPAEIALFAKHGNVGVIIGFFLLCVFVVLLVRFVEGLLDRANL